MDENLEVQAEMVIRKIKHYLITTMGVTVKEATPEDFYRAFALTLREEIMINWAATAKTYYHQQARMLYYLCMEYLPGRFMGSNITNLRSVPLVRMVMRKMGRSFEEELFFESDPGLGNGGLGRLASCFIDSLATQQYPCIAYGLRYQYGIFDQEVWGGIQIERPDPWLLHENPWELRRDLHAVSVYYAGRELRMHNAKGEEVGDLADYEEVRALPYDIPILGYHEKGLFNVNTLRLWTTKESPKNFQLQRFNAGLLDQAGENTGLTDVLYPNDHHEMGKRIRLKQEFLLSSASVQDIVANYMRMHHDMSAFGDKVRIQLNDTHPVFAITELMRILLKDHDFSWREAVEVTKTCCGYTNHTVLREALEEWNQNRLQSFLPRQYRIIERLNMDLCTEIRQRYPGDEERVRRMSIIEGGQVRMANLAIYGSHRVNGVAALHTEILQKELFRDFAELEPVKFQNVTNGVTQRRWLLYCNPRLAAFITERIGSRWIIDFMEIEKLKAFSEDETTLQELLHIKKENKKELISFLQKQNPIRDSRGKILCFTEPLDEHAIFDVHVKRIHEYKRQLMNALHVLMLYFDIQDNPEEHRPARQVLIAGKAAPGYEMAKHIIQLIYCISRRISHDPSVHKKLRLLFLENYNVSKAEFIIPAADVSEQISTAGMEASGTGNMKLTMNGALTVGTEDGANIEMHAHVTSPWWPFTFGCSAEDIRQMKEKRSYNPWVIYSTEAKIRKVIDLIKSGELAESPEERKAITAIYQTLLEPNHTEGPDRYFVLQDLMSFYETQKRVEQLYMQPLTWAKYCLHNIASMGHFSSDYSIHNYAKDIWQLAPVPVDAASLEKVRNEYDEYDRCRIL